MAPIKGPLDLRVCLIYSTVRHTVGRMEQGVSSSQLRPWCTTYAVYSTVLY